MKIFFIILDEKSIENDVLYKTLSGEKSLRIIYNKVDGFIWGYWGTKYLELFGFEKYLIGLETSVTSCFFS